MLFGLYLVYSKYNLFYYPDSMTKKIDIHEIPTEWPKHRDKEEKIEQTKKLLEKLSKLQSILSAQKKYALLVVFQWLDASGKDGVCKSVFGAMNPLNIDFMSRKAPNEEERAHDYLWRLHHRLPQKWYIQVFNRSYYEDILVPTVLKTHDKDVIKKRYDHIKQFEQYMTDNDIIVIKCFFSVSEKVERERMEERLENPMKHRKHNDSDRKTLELREKYLEVYEKILNECDEPEWNFIPADRNREKNYAVAKVLYEKIRELDLEWPSLQTEWTLDEYLEKVENIDDDADFKKLKEKWEQNKKDNK